MSGEEQEEAQRDGREDGAPLPSHRDVSTTTGDDLAVRFAGIARLLQAQDDTDALLDHLVAAAVEVVPGAQDGSVSVVTGRATVTSQHPSSGFPARLDALQLEAGQGPGLDATYEHRTVRVPDMTREQRWPRFAEPAARAGVRSMLALQLSVCGDHLGALNLYSREPGAFDAESERVGLLLASHAAVALADARRIDQLARAVATRDLIGQAKGMLMERFRIDQDQAFRVLTRVSQHTHRPLRDVARELVSTRRLRGLPDHGDAGPPPGAGGSGAGGRGA